MAKPTQAVRDWKLHKSACAECTNKEKLILCSLGTRLINICADEYVARLKSER